MNEKIVPGTFLIILGLMLTGIIAAQDVDHVYLKNGSVIRGNILEIEPVEHVKIEDLCGNIWYYKIDQVEKITAEPFSQVRSGNKENYSFKPGFVNITSVGFLAGSPNNGQVAPFSVLMVNGWKNNLGIFTGLGFGIEFLTTGYIPFFADIRYDLTEGDVVPYLVAKAGYSVPMTSNQDENDINNTYSGGTLAGAGVGLKVKSRSNFAWDISIMYRYQQTSYKETYGWNEQSYKYSDVYNRIEIRLGFYID